MTFHNSGITTYYLLFLILCYPTKVLADVVQWLERLLAKEKVAGSTPVIRSSLVSSIKYSVLSTTNHQK